MSDAELIERLRDACRGGDECKCSLSEAADRIEELVKERDAAEQRGYSNAMEAERKLHEDRIEALEAKLAKAGGLLEAWVELSEHCSIEEGVCCCGESMNGHSNPMDCGHTPLDHGTYIAVQLGKETRAALTTEEGK